MSFFDKRIPTILGLLILLGGIGAGVYFVGKETLFGSSLPPELTPKKVKITNVSNGQFTVSWITSSAAIGLIRYGNTPSLNTTVADDRDQLSGTPAKSKTHYVTIAGLQPASKYYFKIGSDSDKNLFDNSGQPYEILTAPTLGAAPPPDLSSGKILDVSGSPAKGAIVYLNIAGAAPLSALATSDGSWVISLSEALKSDLTGYAEYELEKTPIDIFVQGESQTAKALADTNNDSPVPEITLDQSYDFRKENIADDSASPEIADEKTAQIPSQFNTEPISTPSAKTTISSEVKLTNPSKEGETIHSLKPEILGTGPANKILTITLESPKTYTATVTIDEDGNWSYSPPENLEPGDHTLSIDYVDNDGEEQTVERVFTVVAAANEGLPSFTATPSATSTPSATPSARTSMPSTDSGVPSSGTVTPTVLIFWLGFIFMLAGFAGKLAQSRRHA